MIKNNTYLIDPDFKAYFKERFGQDFDEWIDIPRDMKKWMQEYPDVVERFRQSIITGRQLKKLLKQGKL